MTRSTRKCGRANPIKIPFQSISVIGCYHCWIKNVKSLMKLEGKNLIQVREGTCENEVSCGASQLDLK